MGLESTKAGYNVCLRCDICGRRTRGLKRIRGHWLNPKTGRKVTDTDAWACQACVLRIRNGR